MLRRLAPFALLLLLAGCGEQEQEGTPAPSLAGPPRWRWLAEVGPADGATLALTVRTPVRTRFRLVGADRLEEAGQWRALASGQTVRVYWGSQAEPAAELDDRAPPADRAAGRTTPHAVRMHFQYADAAVSGHRVLFFSRPGRGRIVSASILPPGRYEALPPTCSIELATVLASDLEAGEAQLRHRDLGCRVTRPASLGPQDVIEVTRLFLDIEPLPGAPPPR